MRKIAESFGYRMVNRLLPQVTASAKICGCDPGTSWCRSMTVRCKCAGDCVTVSCICPVGGCK
jgi:hypothetical protein